MQELLLKLARLLCTLSGEVIDSLKRVENGAHAQRATNNDFCRTSYYNFSYPITM